MAEHEGGCECGLVRYRMTDEPMFVNCCHCRQCQKITGSAFAINGMVEADRLELLQGRDRIAAKDGEVRCAQCNTLLWAAHRRFGSKIQFVRLGTLDEAERIKPDAHFFVRSKHSWVVVPADVPTFETLPADGDPPLIDGLAARRLEAARGG